MNKVSETDAFARVTATAFQQFAASSPTAPAEGSPVSGVSNVKYDTLIEKVQMHKEALVQMLKHLDPTTQKYQEVVDQVKKLDCESRVIFWISHMIRF